MSTIITPPSATVSILNKPEPAKKEFSVGMTLFGKETKSKSTITGWAEPQPHTPAVMPTFDVSSNMAIDVLAWMQHISDPLFISGPTGCGKTTTIKQMAARFNWPVYEITGHARLEMSDLVGHLTMRGGTMFYEYGPLALAMRDGGVFLFNELDLCDPSLLAMMNTVLDGAPLCIAENGGEIIKPHALFKFAATANSTGCGDTTGLYQGVLRQNIALMDRFMALKATYLAPDKERELVLAVVPELGEDTAFKYTTFASTMRAAFIGDDEQYSGMVTAAMSTRTVLRWARLTVLRRPLAELGVYVTYSALEQAMLNRCDASTVAVARELYQRVFGVTPPEGV